MESTCPFVGQGGEREEKFFQAEPDTAQHASGDFELAAGPEVAAALDFAYSQLGPRISLVERALFSINDDAKAALSALGAAYVTEPLENLDGCQDESRAHCLGPAGVVHQHLFGPRLCFGEDLGDLAPEFTVTGAEFLEPFHFNKARLRTPLELPLDFLGVRSAARRAEIPDMGRAMLPEHMENRRGSTADGDQGGSDRGLRIGVGVHTFSRAALSVDSRMRHVSR